MSNIKKPIMDNSNPELQLANDFVRYTQQNIFLTGKAGTGKTTFLHHLKHDLAKRMIVTAPTGVAAINAGGVTLHSFFQIPFTPFVAGSDGYQQAQQRRFSKEKINIIRTLDLLIIDEISMVRADVLDAVDAVLRRYKDSNTPFGGVQLLMIGDLHQLSPVVKDNEWSLLKEHYNSYYFFSSHALCNTQLYSIELQHIYRQSEAHFIELLNHVRDNQLDNHTLQTLNSRYQANFQPDEAEGFITLSTHNYSADAINNRQLNALDAEMFHFTASVEDNYPEHNYPTAHTLSLKKGTQVMFVRNDNSQEKRYFNGKIGKVIHINEHSIIVKCPDDEQEIIVETASWKNIKYTINPENKQISEEVIGQFTQYPLRLAWAITIHKSQGLTFEKAIIDAASAFSHGQVYVALSRCKTFSGMVLSSPITEQAVHTDTTITQFTSRISQNTPTQKQLSDARAIYQKTLIIECFNFQSIHSNFNFLTQLFYDNQYSIQLSTLSGMEQSINIEQLMVQTNEEIFNISEKFKRQLNIIIEKLKILDKQAPEDDSHLQERIKKASTYFSEKLQKGLLQWAFSIHFDSDNKELQKRINRAMEFLQKNLRIKQACLESCQDVFTTTDYLQAKAKAGIDFNSKTGKKKQTIDYYALDIEHPPLFEALKKWRIEQANQENINHFQVLHQSIIIQIAIILPDTLVTLKQIKGVGPHTIKKYGETIIALVHDYCQKNNIEANQLEQLILSENKTNPTKTKKQTSDTKKISFELYQSGQSIEEIAKTRGFVQSTIETHLIHYIGLGELAILDFLSNEKISMIQTKLPIKENYSLTEIKKELGDDYSYSDIRMVLEHVKYMEKEP